MQLFTLVLIFCFKVNFVLSQISAYPQKTMYNQNLAFHLRLLCKESYYVESGKCIHKHVPYFKTYFLYEQKTIVCDRSNNICSFFVLYSQEHKSLIFAFSGSKTYTHIAQQFVHGYRQRANFNELGLVHKYLYKSFSNLWPHVKKILFQFMGKKLKVYFTGHSLGGSFAALAAISTEYFNLRKSADIILYTFGQARIGSLQFATNFDKRVPNAYRVVSGDDFLPHYPPCTKQKLKRPRNIFKKRSLPCSNEDLNSYYHHSIEIWYPTGFDTNDKFYECLGFPKNEDFNCCDKILLKTTKARTYWDFHKTYFNKGLYEKYKFILFYPYDKDCNFIKTQKRQVI